MKLFIKSSHKIILGFLVLSLLGCTRFSEPEISEFVIPSRIELQNADQESVGFAIPVSEDMFVAPDHLFVDSVELFWGGEPIDVVARDFEQDSLFFRTKNGVAGLNMVLSDVPPEIGSFLYWESNKGKIHQVEVLGLGQHFTVQNETKTNLIAVSGVVEKGNSGAPVFDKQGKGYGFLIGSDNSIQQSFVVRGDLILDFLRESIDE